MNLLQFSSMLNGSSRKAKQGCDALSFVGFNRLIGENKFKHYNLRQTVKLAKKHGWNPAIDWREQIKPEYMYYNISDYDIKVTYEETEGGMLWVGRVTELPDVTEYADTKEEAEDLVWDTISTTMQVFREEARAFPPPLKLSKPAVHETPLIQPEGK